ncbi:trehalose-phosphatase [Psychrobacter sp. TAE2020]|uniref:trehalose-phosphatase n=1 Tax=Psychrobacter sp. TAE2020 TaxID=2846762 RepID=UPI002B48008F|nr:trehalose-phosphatase [Psychrobacter sp. TAE2020]
MTSITELSLNGEPLYIEPEYIQPNKFADYLSIHQQYALFLDIDGTLAEFTVNPKDSFIPKSTLMLLRRIQDQGVEIAFVTGRSLTEARQMLRFISASIAATHGLEVAFETSKHQQCDNDTNNKNTRAAQVNVVELDEIRQAITQSCLSYQGFTIEDKPYSVALHYRQNPALAQVAYSITSIALKNYSDWLLKPGKYVWEIVPKGVDKGTAILTLLKTMQTNTSLCPIFIGDDFTDEAGFIAVQGEEDMLDRSIKTSRLIEDCQDSIKGMGIKVGSEPSGANYYVRNIEEVSFLLESFLTFCQKRSVLPADLVDAY